MVTSSATVSGICSAGYPSKAIWPNSLGDFENFTSSLLVSLALGCIFLLLGHPDISAATTTNINKRSISNVYNAGVINIHFIDITHRRVQALICRIKRTFFTLQATTIERKCIWHEILILTSCNLSIKKVGDSHVFEHLHEQRMVSEVKCFFDTSNSTRANCLKLQACHVK